MAERRPGQIVWRRRTPPTRAVAEFTAKVPEEAVKDFLAYVKRTAGGSVRSNRGQRWPVLTGYSRDRFALSGRLGRGRERPPSRILIQSADYAPFPDARGGGIINRLWRRWNSKEGGKTVRKVARRQRKFL